MASRPSGLRQPSTVKSSNPNLASSSGASAGTETPAATPAKQTGGSSAIPMSAMSRLPSSSSIRRKITTPAGINPPGSRDSGLATDIDNFIIGDTVYVSGDPNKRGKICFMGEVDFAKGDFAGIVLDLPIGNHDGMVQGKRYFQCAPSHGLFTKLSRLSRDPVLDSPSTPRAPQSTTSSAVMSPDPQISSAASIAERTPSPSPAKSTLTLNSNLNLGERVIVASATGGTKIGILRYLGTTDFAAGDWAGVELLTPMGKNNGSVGGKSYFKCKEKHGLFVPASKVISSPVNKTPRRHGSRESLISVSSMASSAASRSIRRPSMRDTQCLPTCSLQGVLAEKEKHVERLLKERELDRVDLANLSRQFEEKILEVKRLQTECASYQQQMQVSAGDNETITKLQNSLEEEHRKLEDLQYTLDEEKIMKADLQAQLDALSAKSSEDSKKSVELSAAEVEECNKEIEILKSQLLKQEADAKVASANLMEAQTQIQTFEKTIAELTLQISTLSDESATAKEDRSKLVSTHEIEVAALKKSVSEQTEVINKLNLQLGEKKRREEELKEKLQSIEVEYQSIHKQKCSLEAEVMDLVNSKTDTSELLSGKIKDLSEEIQELRGKLQSTEEDKAVLRRINAEFKSRIAQHEQSEAALKKEIEESQAKLAAEKTALEKQLADQTANLDSESQKLQEAISTKEQEISSLKEQVTKLNECIASERSSLEKLQQDIKSMKTTTSNELANKTAEYEQQLKKAQDENAALVSEAAKKENELNQKNSELLSKINELSSQLSSSAEESRSLKTEIDAVKAELKKTALNSDEKSEKIKKLEEDISALKKKTEEDSSALDELYLKVDALKKDKSTLKEQIAAYKADSNRFQEIEKGLSQELAVLRNKLEQKSKAVSDLEKELAEKKADIESSKATLLDANSPKAHIEFLNSIIVDLQAKNEELNIKLNVLVNGGVDADPNSNQVTGAGGSSARAYQSLRPYCDICEKFDLHDTEDCPAQASEDNTNTHYGAVRGESRPYCETCEIFGHVTGECDDQETY